VASLGTACSSLLSLDEYEPADGGSAEADAGTDGPPVSEGGSCELGINPVSHDFGLVEIGDASAPAQLIVVNAAGETRGPITLSGGDPPNPNFKIVEQTCAGATLSQDSTCTIDFVFAPKAVGLHTTPLFVRAGGLECATAFLRGQGTTGPPPEPPDAGSPPTGKVVVDPPVVSDTQIGLTWAPVERATEYGVLWSTVYGGAGVTVTETWVVFDTDTSLEHWFSIFPCNAAGCGDPTYVGPVKK